MRVWIDLANSPHVLFFAPILAEMRRRGVDITVTARDFAQTVKLAGLHGIEIDVVGRHGGKSTTGKAWAIASRSVALRASAKRSRPDLAVSHNSYAQAIAARSLHVPFVTLMDYEHTPANHVSFRLARQILLPSSLRGTSIEKYGATPEKIVYYDGFKEQVYLDAFEPDRSRLHPGLPEEVFDGRVVVVARPPADFAIYHRFQNTLFGMWLARVGTDPGAVAIVLPRTATQRAEIEALGYPSVLLPREALDGANLVHHADLVVSAGGTMNREAAVLGVPAYSIFAGTPAAVDAALEDLGRLVRIREEGDIDRIRLEKKRGVLRLRNPDLLRWIVDAVLGSVDTLEHPSLFSRALHSAGKDDK